MYSVWSSEYLDLDVDSYNCYVNEDIWRRITNDFTTNRMFARITKGEKFWICALGAPIPLKSDFGERDTPSIFAFPNIFVPNWMLEQIGCEGNGSIMEVEWMPSEAFDESTKIVLQSIDTDSFSDNIQELLSIELTKLAVLQKNTRILVKIPELDGFEVEYIVRNLEPASVVLCQGDEVDLEFYEERVPTPIPELPELLVPSAPPISPPINEVVAPAPVPLLGGIKRSERYNPWRDKDFKPNMS